MNSYGLVSVVMTRENMTYSNVNILAKVTKLLSLVTGI